jgi:tetratricopeptide (TPR) repeat protein
LLAAGPSALAQETTDAAAAPTQRIAAVPFAALPGVESDLCFRFWSGVMDQLEAAEVELLASGVLAKTARNTAYPLTGVVDDGLAETATLLDADWVLGGTLEPVDGKVRAQGVGYRASDGTYVRTPTYTIEEGERDKAVSEMSAFLVGLVLTGDPRPSQPRDVARDNAVVSAGLHLQAGLESIDPAVADTEAAAAVATLSAYIAAATPPFPVGSLGDLLRSALVLRPAYVDAVVALGELHLVRGATSDALAAFQWASELAEGGDSAAILANAYQRLGRYDAALEVVTAAMEAGKNTPELHNIMGLLYWRHLDDPVNAAAAFQEAIALDPTGEASLPARFNLSSLMLTQGQADEALALLDEALVTSPNDANVHFNRGLALHTIARRDENADQLVMAMDEYAKALELDPTHAKAHCNTGVLLAQMGDLEAAVTHYLAAIAGDSSLTVAYRNLAIAYEGLEQYSEAAQMWRDYAGLEGVDPARAQEALDRAEALQPTG